MFIWSAVPSLADHLRRRPLLGRLALEESLGDPLGARNALITFHPVTLEPGDGIRQQNEVLAALDSLSSEWAFWFTMPNADPGGRGLGEALKAWARNRPRARIFDLAWPAALSQPDARG